MDKDVYKRQATSSAIFISKTKAGRSNQPLIIHKVMINIHAQVLQSAKLKVDEKVSVGLFPSASPLVRLAMVNS